MARPVRRLRRLTKESQEIKTLRLALDVSQSENEALRRELDRLLKGITKNGSGQQGGAKPTNADLVAQATARAEQVRSLEEKAREAIAAGQGAAQAIADLANLGPAAYPALEQLYLESSDPAVRKMIFPTLMFVGGRTQGMDFLMKQLDDPAADPKMRGSLLLAASVFADRKSAPAIQDHLIDTIYDPNLSSGLRAAAVRALRYATGPNVEAALVAAANDPNEKVRLRAIERLATSAQRDSASMRLVGAASGRGEASSARSGGSHKP